MLNSVTYRKDGEKIFKHLTLGWEKVLNELGFMSGELRVVKADAGDTYFLTQQLQHVITEIVKQPVAPNRARLFIPVDNSMPSGAKTWLYTVLDEIGYAAVITDYSMDLPPATVVKSQVTGTCISFGNSVIWSVQDLRNADFSGMPLSTDMLNAASSASEASINKTAAFGHVANNLPGFLNNVNVPLIVLPTGTWSSATPKLILADLRHMASQIAEAVFHNPELTPDSLLLDSASWSLLSDTEVNDNTTDSILKRFIDSNQYINNAAVWHELDLANVGGNGPRIVMYRRDPACVRLIIPQELEFFPAQAKNLAFVTPTHFRHGGVDWRKPVTGAYSDDI